MHCNRHSLWKIMEPGPDFMHLPYYVTQEENQPPSIQKTDRKRSIQAIELEDTYDIEVTMTPSSSLIRRDFSIDPQKEKNMHSKAKTAIGRRCNVSGCTSMARSRGLCTAHGGGKKCLSKNCNNIAQSRGYCRSHGGGSRCKISDCPRSAQSRGLCRKHGGGQICRMESCMSSVVSNGLCRAHGGGKACHFSGCTSIASTSQLCKAHSEEKVCEAIHCTNICRRGKSLCIFHGNATNFSKHSKIQNLAGLCQLLADGSTGLPTNQILLNHLPVESKPLSKKRKCQQEGCTSNAQSRGLCRAHGGGSRCRVEGCKSSAQSGGLCRSHGGGKSCQVEGCPRNAKSGGLCISHGGGKRCKVPKCTRSVQSRGVCKAHGARAQTRLQLLCGVACA